MIAPTPYLWLGAGLFTIGVVGVLTRRNSILVGALIGLLLGILAALLWEPAVRVARRTSV